MRHVHYALALALGALLVLSGCITYSQQASQSFKDDGTSVLKLDGYMGYPPEVDEKVSGWMDTILSSYAASYGTDTGDSAEAMRMLVEGTGDYFRAGGYAKWECRQASSVNCTWNTDGHTRITVSLKPGEFYNYENEMDWVNLQQVRTYEIRQMPLTTYYYAQNRSPFSFSKSVRDSYYAHLGTYIEEHMAAGSKIKQSLLFAINMASLSDPSDNLDSVPALKPLKASMERLSPQRVDTVIDFSRGMISGSAYEDIKRLDGFEFTDELPALDFKFGYSAEFESPIASAMIGGKNLSVQEGKRISLDLDAMNRYGPGAIVVKVQKPLSPLGAFTWAIPVAVCLLVLWMARPAQKKEHAHRKRE